MAIRVSKLRYWLNKLNGDEVVCIDDDGLTLMTESGDDYIEVGRLTNPEDYEEVEIA